MPASIRFHLYECAPAAFARWISSKLPNEWTTTEVSRTALFESDLGTIMVMPIESEPPFLSVWFDGTFPWKSPLDCVVQVVNDMRLCASCLLGDRAVDVRPGRDGSVQVETICVTEEYVGPRIEHINSSTPC
jgi:hypothetical protein